MSYLALLAGFKETWDLDTRKEALMRSNTLHVGSPGDKKIRKKRKIKNRIAKESRKRNRR